MSKHPIESPMWLNVLLLGVAVYELVLLIPAIVGR
jgi:hypothetical protein